MKIIIMAPKATSFFTREQRYMLSKAGDVIYVDGPKPFIEVKELFSKDKKIIALDPDFCEWKIPNELLDKIPNLNAVCLQTTSFSWIDIEHMKKKGIVVTNLRGFSGEAVAEWAIMTAMNLARKIPLVIKNDWTGDYTKHKGIEMKGKIAGIVGLGRNGSRIAEICNSLGMRVIYWSKNSRNKNFKYVELKELMSTSDLIFPTFAQNAETEKLLTDSMLKSMKKTAIFVSTIHKIYNHKLLLEMVKKGDLFGYGFEQSSSEFIEFEKFDGNIWAGPELAWATEDSIKKNAMQWTESIISASKGKYPTRAN